MNKENDQLVDSLLEELAAPIAQDSEPAVSWKSTETGDLVLARAKIPEKAFFRIGEVAKIVGVKPYVLRYWESEFSLLKPQKSRSQQRVYRRSDVESVLLVKHLLYAERYSIEGARLRIKELKREGELSKVRKSIASGEVVEEKPSTDPVMTDAARERIQNLAREVVLLIHSFEERVLGS